MKNVKRPDTSITFTEPSLTKQSFKKECDVNSVLERYKKTGSITHVRQGQGQYGDFTGHTDYQTSVNSVITAQETFMALPAVIRKRFGNDPSQLLEFLSHEENFDQAKQMGLLSHEAISKRQKRDDDLNDNAKKASADASKGEATPKA